ncbi:hypothetical protein ALC57_18574 [Trachymyrmex cornetzi]|uniref:Transposase Tc1-like domain-containing protein n=1 Tax=Trachymyrmex cornetzi TaxID=471704 RepID=A0A151IRS0_9HYME|nr:hypothetical protein ALC57_18574 [Trachymyrmex cornetzi]
MNISVGSIHKILKENKYHPFKLTFVQHLRPTDETRHRIMWTDKSKFTNNGIINRRNQHFWSSENPHWIRVRNFEIKIGT